MIYDIRKTIDGKVAFVEPPHQYGMAYKWLDMLDSAGLGEYVNVSCYGAFDNCIVFH